MKFCDILGHNDIKSDLISEAKDGRESHAYIFAGPAGVGKFSAALAFSSFLLCGNKSGSDSCGVCKNCKMSLNFEHPDVRIVTNELYGVKSGASEQISVDTVRKMKSEVFIKPYGDKKIYIVPNAEKLTVQAQNSLLRILEEPPPYSTIILVCENLDAILPTVLSRCVLIRFGKVEKADICDYLANAVKIDVETAKIIAQISGGSVEKALNLSKNVEALDLRHNVIEGIVKLSGGKFADSYRFSAFLQKNKARADFVGGIIQSFLSDLVKIKFESAEPIENLDKIDEIKSLAKKIPRDGLNKIIDNFLIFAKYLKANVGFNSLTQQFAVNLQAEICA
jgi:DNA polymerase-3 subunit delta'